MASIPRDAEALTYSDLPDRLVTGHSVGEFYERLPELLPQLSADPSVFAAEPGPVGAIAKTLNRLPRDISVSPSSDGDTERLGPVTVTHRFVEAPGDGEMVRWHLVDSGHGGAGVVIFLHGVPDSWWQWHYAIEALAPHYRCIAVDLKGYGQSDKRTGDYRHEGVAEQLIALFDELGVDEFSLVTHDRGSPPGDHIAAKIPDRVRRYGRGQQHLWHYNPVLSPQEALFTAPHAPLLLAKPREFVALAYTLLAKHPAAIDDLTRAVSEFSHPGIATAVPRYFHSSSFRQEWVERRHALIGRWRAPVTLLQGRHDSGQPHEYYTQKEVLERLPDGSGVHLFDAGHFWPFEAPQETTQVLANFMTTTRSTTP